MRWRSPINSLNQFFFNIGIEMVSLFFFGFGLVYFSEKQKVLFGIMFRIQDTFFVCLLFLTYRWWIKGSTKLETLYMLHFKIWIVCWQPTSSNACWDEYRLSILDFSKQFLLVPARWAPGPDRDKLYVFSGPL